MSEERINEILLWLESTRREYNVRYGAPIIAFFKEKRNEIVNMESDLKKTDKDSEEYKTLVTKIEQKYDEYNYLSDNVNPLNYFKGLMERIKKNEFKSEAEVYEDIEKFKKEYFTLIHPQVLAIESKKDYVDLPPVRKEEKGSTDDKVVPVPITGVTETKTGVKDETKDSKDDTDTVVLTIGDELDKKESKDKKGVLVTPVVTDSKEKTKDGKDAVVVGVKTTDKKEKDDKEVITPVPLKPSLKDKVIKFIGSKKFMNLLSIGMLAWGVASIKSGVNRIETAINNSRDRIVEAINNKDNCCCPQPVTCVQPVVEQPVYVEPTYVQPFVPPYVPPTEVPDIPTPVPPRPDKPTPIPPRPDDPTPIPPRPDDPTPIPPRPDDPTPVPTQEEDCVEIEHFADPEVEEENERRREENTGLVPIEQIEEEAPVNNEPVHEETGHSDPVIDEQPVQNIEDYDYSQEDVHQQDRDHDTFDDLFSNPDNLEQSAPAPQAEVVSHVESAPQAVAAEPEVHPAEAEEAARASHDHAEVHEAVDNDSLTITL